jgi:signal transduction histidine kinase
LPGLLQRGVEAMVGHLDAAFARIWTLNEAQQMLELRASAGLYTHLDGPHGRVPVGRLKIGRIAQERKPHLTNTVLGDPLVDDQDWARREGMVAFAGYPLVIDGRLVGVMAMFARHRLTDFTLEALAAVADEIALGIERKRDEEALQQEARVAAVLAKVGQELIAALNTPALLDRLCQATGEALGCDRSAVVVWQPEEKVYRVAAGYGYTPKQWGMLSTLQLSPEALESIIARLRQREVVEVTADMPLSLAQAIFRTLGTTVALCVGLWQGQDLIGYQVLAYQGRREFTPDHSRIVSGIAQLASLVLTDAQLFAELERAHRLKDDFLGTLSHELRTPLSAIMGYTGLVLEGAFGPLTAEQSNALQRVKKAAERELGLIIAMLDVSQLQAGRLQVVREAVNVTELMEELGEETRQRLDTKPGVGLVWRVPPVLPQLHTDRTKLKVVLQNLLSNAVKFTEQGHVTVDVYPSAGGLEFCVADTGIGIALEVRPVMFEMFGQGESSATRRYGGVGLGLYIVRQMLEILGGTVRVESEVGRGSTFRVWVPRGA